MGAVVAGGEGLSRDAIGHSVGVLGGPVIESCEGLTLAASLGLVKGSVEASKMLSKVHTMTYVYDVYLIF